MLRSVVSILLVIGLAGCGGGGGGGGGSTLPPPADPPPAGSSALLVPAGSTAGFESYMRSSLKTWGGLSESSSTIETALSASPFPEAARQVVQVEGGVAAAADGASFDSSVSKSTGTNVLVSNVDEIDAVKYDGTNLFLANNQSLTIVDTTRPGNGAVISETQLIDDGYANISGLYLYENAGQRHLAAIRSGGGQVYYLAAVDSRFAPWFWENDTKIDLIDAAVLSSPQLTEHIEIDGSLIQSRRIGNTLYVVTRFSPYLEGYQPFARDEKAIAANEKALAAADPSTFIPKVRSRSSGERDLLDPGTCLIPNTSVSAVDEGYPTLTTITAIDIEQQVVTGAACLAEGVWGMHMTESALYIASPSRADEKDSSFYNGTTLHKFGLSGASIEYRGSGTVAGNFWGDPAFLMGEHEGNLTVVTTESSNDGRGGFAHRLSILGEAGDLQLKTVGAIPNETRTQAIGKPNEQIFAARILGNRAYIVTFERIDPVYAIDLTNPADPAILGELEIPGFSSYLHPVSEGLLLGVGSDTRLEGDRVVTEGLNLRLFDVSDPANVRLLAEQSIGRQGTYTPAMWDYHAFTMTQVSDDSWRFALPVNRYGAHQPANDNPDDFRGYGWTDNALHLFEINGTSLRSIGQITSEDQATGERYYSGCCNWQDRSFFNGDTVNYLSKNQLFTADWNNPGLASSTFISTLWRADPTQCGDYKRDPVYVTLFDRDTGDYLSCGYSTLREGEVSLGIAVGEPNPADPSTDPSNDPDLPPKEPDIDVKPDPIVCSEPKISFDRPVTEAGSYNLTVSREGYQLLTANNVNVQADACGLTTTYLSLYLKRQ